MRKIERKLQVAEFNGKKPLDTTVIPASYYRAMKPKKQPVFNLRMTKAQKDAVRRAAKAEGRSMHNYIIRAIVSKAAEDLRNRAQSAVEALAS